MIILPPCGYMMTLHARQASVFSVVPNRRGHLYLISCLFYFMSWVDFLLLSCFHFVVLSSFFVFVFSVFQPFCVVVHGRLVSGVHIPLTQQSELSHTHIRVSRWVTRVEWNLKDFLVSLMQQYRLVCTFLSCCNSVMSVCISLSIFQLPFFPCAKLFYFPLQIN